MTLAPQRMLIAQSDAPTLELAATRLSLAGYAVSTARTGRQAIDALHDVRPHGLILDLELAGLTGFDVLQSMNRTRAIERTAVLAMSQSAPIAKVRLALGMGARDYLQRPFQDEVFLARIRRLLSAPAPRKPIQDNDLLL